jgi:chromate transporter
MGDWTELWELFTTFLMIGAVSFGGGYAMIPVIQREVMEHQWMTLPAFTDAIALASMSPGPIATNSAIIVGYQAAGVSGAIISTIGTILPSLLIILALAPFLYKMKQNEWVKKGFYGLRPIVTGLIFYAAITFAIGNGVVPVSLEAIRLETVGLFIIFAAALIALIRFKVHPAAVIFISGLAGAAFFT